MGDVPATTLQHLGDAAGLERFGALIGGNEHLKTALSDGVAARLESEAWFAGLAQLASLGTPAQTIFLSACAFPAPRR